MDRSVFKLRSLLALFGDQNRNNGTIDTVSFSAGHDYVESQIFNRTRPVHQSLDNGCDAISDSDVSVTGVCDHIPIKNGSKKYYVAFLVILVVGVIIVAGFGIGFSKNSRPKALALAVLGANIHHHKTTVKTSSTPSKTTENPTTIPIGLWSEWGVWSICTVRCGTGKKQRYRSCPDGNKCQGEFIQQSTCGTAECSGLWSEWDTWSICPVTCGTGTKTRYRSCPVGKTCGGAFIQQNKCGSTVCPGYGSWATWTSWGSCGVTCGGGVRSRSRSCTKTDIRDIDCAGDNIMKETCNAMNCIELLYFIQEPKPKSRLSGESMTMCCIAQANVTYYEWFRDDILLDSALSNGTHLTLTELEFRDSSSYYCRAHSQIGVIESTETYLAVRSTPDEFCSSSRISKWINLPHDCVQSNTTTLFDVRDCLPVSCRSNNISETGQCSDDVVSCCSITEFEIATIHCSNYALSYLIVRSCGCVPCREITSSIKFSVKAYNTSNPLYYGEVHVNSESKFSYTTAYGVASVHFENSVNIITVTFKDTYRQQFLDTTKVIELNGDELENVNLMLTVYMVAPNNEISINPTEGNSTVKCINEIDKTGLTLTFVNNYFVFPSGVLYKGTVKVNLTCIHPNSTGFVDKMPGRLQYINTKGERSHLENYIVFNVQFKDDHGDRLYYASLVYVKTEANDQILTKNFSMWGLNEDNGIWYSLSTENKSKNRSEEAFFNITLHQWYAINRPLVTNECFFKIRVYKDSSLNLELSHTITHSQIIDFVSSVSVVISENWLSKPSQECQKIHCSGDVSTINVEAFNTDKLKFESLRPLQKGTNRNGVSTSVENYLKYTVTQNNFNFKVKLVVDENGPFYHDKAKCELSHVSENHFKLYLDSSSNDIFTFMSHYELSNSLNNDILKEVQTKVWYQETNGFTNVCLIKIKVINSFSEMKVRVVSSGGTHPDIAGDILGIREVELDVNSAESVCIPYKCSGPINDLTGITQNDFTKVVINVIRDPEVRCTVQYENGDLIEGHYLNTPNIGKSTFSIFAPMTDTDGLYFHDAVSGQEALAYSIAEARCNAGNNYDTPSIQSDKGVAVTFTCT